MIYVENDGIIKKLSLNTPLQAIGTQLKVWEAVSDAPDPLQDALNAIPYIILLTGVETMKFAIINDTKTAGSNGGTFTAGSWVQRTLNTLMSADNFVSLSANNVTILETGKYLIRALVPASGVNYHQSRLTKNGAELAVGTVGLVGQIAANAHSHVMYCGYLTAGDIIRLEHRCSVTYATYGLGAGVDATWGNVVFSVMEIIQYS